MSEPNARRTTHLTRDAAWELLTRYNKDAFHLHHAETVEKTMRYFARELGYAEDEDYWGIVGMLHDIDFEQWPQYIPIYGYIYDVKTGALVEVPAATQVGKAQ